MNMNFEQAREYSFLVKWKVAECFSGPVCWCRLIVPIEPIYYTNPESTNSYEYSIVDAAALDQTTAEYIVKLHNEHLDRTLKLLKEDMDILNTGLRPLDSITITNTTLKDDYRVICRKEID